MKREEEVAEREKLSPVTKGEIWQLHNVAYNMG